MLIKDALRIRDRFVNVVHHIQTLTEKTKSTHDWMLNELIGRVYSNPDYKRLPRWAKAYIDGVRDTLYYDFYNYRTECRWRVKGSLQLLHHDQIGGKDQIRWQDVELAGRFYKGTDKPF